MIPAPGRQVLCANEDMQLNQKPVIAVAPIMEWTESQRNQMVKGPRVHAMCTRRADKAGRSNTIEAGRFPKKRIWSMSVSDGKINLDGVQIALRLDRWSRGCTLID